MSADNRTRFLTSPHELTFPTDAVLIAEANLPAGMADLLAGKIIVVAVLPEEQAEIRIVEADEVPSLVDERGQLWNPYRPIQVEYIDKEGKTWRLPRKWLSGSGQGVEADIHRTYSYHHEVEFAERLLLPTFWDLLEINIPKPEAWNAGGSIATVHIQIAPNELPKLTWRDSAGAFWRIPHNWRRRRIMLPARNVLAAQDVPEDVAMAFAQQTVTVNYHPGSLCCLPDQYRFQDNFGRKWPVKIKNCVLIGYGEESEFRA